MTNKIQKTEKTTIPQDERAEAQEWIRPNETPFDAYLRHQMDLGMGHYM